MSPDKARRARSSAQREQQDAPAFIFRLSVQCLPQGEQNRREDGMVFGASPGVWEI